MALFLRSLVAASTMCSAARLRKGLKSTTASSVKAASRIVAMAGDEGNSSASAKDLSLLLNLGVRSGSFWASAMVLRSGSPSLMIESNGLIYRTLAKGQTA